MPELSERLVHLTSVRSDGRQDGRGSVANPTRIPLAERRCGVRQKSAATPREHLWLMCEEGSMGGQVVVRNLSVRGIGIAVNRSASRLTAALDRARRSRGAVSVYRTLHDGHQKARVVWGAETKSSEVHFGLELTPLKPSDDVA